MRILLLAIVASILAIPAYAQRYTQPIFPSSTVERDIVYGSAPDYQGTGTSLLLDLYQPDGDNAPARALVILVHGGGFTGGGKAGENFQAWGDDLARRGYVVASIDYRLGLNDKTNGKDIWEASLRAGQDVRAAVRYLRSMRTTHRIDTGHIFLVGSSAGGLASIQASVLQDDEIPAYVDPLLGGVEGSSGTPLESSRVHGLVILWGATTDTLFIESGDPPLFAVHGTGDKTVPYQCGPSRFGLDLCGAVPLVNRARTLGITSEAQLFEGAGHILDSDPVLLDSCFRFYAARLATLATSGAPSGVIELDGRKGTTTYPNPALPGANVTIAIDREPPANVFLCDISGRRYPVAWHRTMAGHITVNLPDGLQPGLMLITVQTASGAATTPIIVSAR